MKLDIDTQSKTPIYKQLVHKVEHAIKAGHLSPGDQLPSMNELADDENISRETVKKAYSILVKNGIVTPKQGKGFYVNDPDLNNTPKVLVIFDKLSVYKQLTFNTLNEALSGKADITVLTHNQSVELLEYFLDSHLDEFDYYVISPHFPQDDATQQKALKLISRVPNRKLIMLDHWLKDLPGNYGAVYQDFDNDVYEGLRQGFDRIEQAGCIKVLTLPESLYGASIRHGIERFASDYRIKTEFYTRTPETINPGDVFLVLNSQLDWGLAELARRIEEHGLQTGIDVFVISYNDFALNEVVLGGLTTISADFAQMGALAARMIQSGNLSKIHCDFRMNRRHTF
ncbi:MAG: GntR family transcriptional regulator [Bacteroidales bacterium]|nr:GntR family transcriptional regulator [Bacteroidales bacterium]